MLDSLLSNLTHPPVLFFFLGVFAILVKSDLTVPPQVGKFFSLYLLFDIGLKGGEELFHSGITFTVVKVMLACLVLSFLIPWVVYPILKKKLVNDDAGAIAATYGSISAVTFATGVSFLDSHSTPFGGYMVAGMALMESPAIVAGLLLIAMNRKEATSQLNWKKVLHESFFNGSVLLLVGALVIGLACGTKGEEELRPFVSGIFAGMLSLYMLDMGLTAGARLTDLKASGAYLITFALFYPLFGGALGITVAHLIGLSVGDALLLTILSASASYIAVPAAMRISVPKANMSLLLPMSLGITFTFNVTMGIPLFYEIISYFWR